MPENSVPAIQIDRVTKTYVSKGHVVVANDDISLTVPRGEIVGLLGPNGAGKTTLVRQIVGLLRPDRGRIVTMGIDVGTHVHRLPSMVGYLSQRPWALLEHVVRDALYYTARLRGLSRTAARIECDRLTEVLGVEPLSAKRFESLSGGEARLCALAVALVARPPLLVLDEPTNDLAPEKRMILWRLLSEWKRDGGTVLVVSHNLLEVEQHVDRVILMYQGRIQRAELLQTLKTQSATRRRIRCVADPSTQKDIVDVLQKHDQIHVRCDESQISITCSVSAVERIIQVLSVYGENIEISPPSLEDLYMEMFTKNAALRE